MRNFTKVSRLGNVKTRKDIADAARYIEWGVVFKQAFLRYIKISRMIFFYILPVTACTLLLHNGNTHTHFLINTCSQAPAPCEATLDYG